MFVSGRTLRGLADLTPGTIVNGDYVVGEVAGFGAYSVVYQATWRSRHDAPVAIKVMHEAVQDHFGDGRANPFLAEQALCSRLMSDAVCPVLQVGKTGRGRYFMVLELAPGETLEAHLKKHPGGLPFHQTADIVKQLAKAIGEMHCECVVHRDIKPANTMLSFRDNGTVDVRIIDFGAARPIDIDDGRDRQDMMLEGTPAYMAPEQAARKRVDYRADVYSLAAVAYEMLTGQKALTTRFGTADEYEEYLLSPKPIPSRPAIALRPDLPLEVSNRLNRALARNVDLRPSTALAFLDGITLPLLGTEVVRPPGFFKRLWSKLKRKPRKVRMGD